MEEAAVADRAEARRGAAVLPAAEASAAAEATPAVDLFRVEDMDTADAVDMDMGLEASEDFAEATTAMGIRVGTTDGPATMERIIPAIITTTMVITAIRITHRPTITSQRRFAARQP